MVNEANGQFTDLKDKLFKLNNQELLSRLPLDDINKFLDEHGIQSPRGRLLIVDSSNRRNIHQILEGNVDIGDDTLHNDGAFIRELGIIVVRWQDPIYDIDNEVAIARMSKTIVHESVHGDGYASGLLPNQSKLGYVDLTQNTGYYLEEGICEYLAREYLSRTVPHSWLSHMNVILSKPRVSSRYVEVPEGSISSATDKVILNPKNEHTHSLNATAIFLTPNRLKDPHVDDSSLAALGISSLICDQSVPLKLFISARKSPQDYQTLQDAINTVDPNLFGMLLETEKNRASFWSTTLDIQKKAH